MSRARGSETPALALLAHVPPSFANTCVPGEGVEGRLGERLSASVLCTAAAPASVEYSEYRDRRAADARVRPPYRRRTGRFKS